MEVFRCALLAWLASILEADGREQLLVINAAHTEFEMKWLEGGIGDTSDGATTGRVPAGSRKDPATFSMNTAPGHAFVLSGGGLRSKAFAHNGGVLNLAIVKTADPSIEVEVMGGQELSLLARRTMKACKDAGQRAACAHGVRSPMTNVVIPSDVMARILEEWSAGPTLPSLITENVAAKPLEADGLIFVSSTSFPVQIRWLLPGTEETGGAKEELRNNSEGIWKLPQSTDSSASAAHCQLKAEAKHRFYMLGPKSKASPASEVVEHPGELALVGVKEGSLELEVELVDEDSLKVLLSNVARSCAAQQKLSAKQTKYQPSWEVEVQECFASNARLPRTGILLTREMSLDAFTKLWSTWDHWRLCSYQDVAAPIKTLEFGRASRDAGSSGISVQVLREDPLVIAVPGFATADECAALSEQAGHDLTQAMVGGVGQTGASRSRRTLTKNLFPDWDVDNSTLTQISYRFFHMARQATGYDLFPEGQEPVNWLFYKPGYEYRPHCDGACGTSSVTRGKRVASSLLYCNVASEGGGTVFPPDNLKIEATAGMYMLFAYNPDPKGLSQHAACPVLKGSKTTATQWYREGVNEDTPWDNFENWGSFTKPKPACTTFKSKDDCPPRCDWTGSSCSRRPRAEVMKHPEL
eukprot:TRINITY_DN32924_c0_g1_i1.p1 TRINITY_DN32924_c0_g1~~TRINITY_DN32924_c0_g1_i1.p1  ORF type:complete len:640 (+),score=106.89 TRINITY_DN32924_c0_g1_i1:7-1926(+)